MANVQEETMTGGTEVEGEEETPTGPWVAGGFWHNDYYYYVFLRDSILSFFAHVLLFFLE